MATHTIIFSAKRQELRVTNGFSRFASDTINFIKARFELDETWKEYDVVRAVWQNDAFKLAQLIEDNVEIAIPMEMLSRRSVVHVNLVGCEVDNGELIERLTTYPCKACIIDKTALVEGDSDVEVSPSLFDQYIARVSTEVDKVLDMTVSAHNSDEPEVIKTVGDVVNLDFGIVKGDPGTPGRDGADGINGVDGIDGSDGVGIESIDLTDSEGLVDTYTITYTNGSTTTYNVTNGADGDSGTTDYNDLINKPTIPDAVSVTQITTSGTNIADITIGETTTHLYAPEGGGGGGIVTETDPIFTASAAYGISSSDIDSWDSKSDFSGSYTDLTNKPSNATTSADGFMSSTDKSKLDSIIMTNGLIDSSILPSYVDDVVEAYGRGSATALSADWLSLTLGGTALTPETGKIYILMLGAGSYAANQQFRWSGSTYVPLSSAGDGTFIAEYGQTSYTDVLYAMAYGKSVFCRINYITHMVLAPIISYRTVDNSDEITFGCTDGNYDVVITLSETDGWDATRTLRSQVQSNWNESDTTSPAYIQNKPPLSITNYIYPGTGKKIADINLRGTTTSLYASEWFVAEYNVTSYTDVKNACDADRNIVCKDTVNGDVWYLPLVEFDSANQVFYFSGIRNQNEEIRILAYNGGWDDDTISVAHVQSNWNETVSTQPSYILNKPTIPTAVSDLTNDSGFITASDVPSEVFLATYGTTTSAQIEAAYQAGKIVCAKDANTVYMLTQRGSDKTHIFCSIYKYEDDPMYLSLIKCTNNTWSVISSFTPANASSIPTATSDLTNDSGFITSADVPDEIFWATYGTTTLAQINSALAAWKLVYVEYGGVFYPLTKINSSSSLEFTCVNNGIAHRITLINNVWSATSSGICPLNSSNKIDASYLPVYNGGVS